LREQIKSILTNDGKMEGAGMIQEVTKSGTWIDRREDG
jgi:hypothetical protein